METSPVELQHRYSSGAGSQTTWDCSNSQKAAWSDENNEIHEQYGIFAVRLRSNRNNFTFHQATNPWAGYPNTCPWKVGTGRLGRTVTGCRPPSRKTIWFCEVGLLFTFLHKIKWYNQNISEQSTEVKSNYSSPIPLSLVNNHTGFPNFIALPWGTRRANY